MLHAAVGIAAIRTALFVPLRKDTTVLGYISAQRQEVRRFTDKQIALLENFAAQAVIAMENARLITEQREALEQQTATAEVLQVINASPGNLAPVFDAMLEKAMRLCGAAFGSLYTYDGEHFHSAAQRGVPVAYSSLRERTPPSGRSGGPGTRILQTKRTVHILDMTSEEATSPAKPEFGRWSSLVAPALFSVCRCSRTVTSWATFRYIARKCGPSRARRSPCLENFAAQAVIAMENARLLTEQREALEQQTATAEVLQVINTSPGNLAPVFDAVLEKAMRLCGAAFGSLYTYDGERFHSAAQRGVPPAFATFRAENPPLTTSGSGPAILLETRRPRQVLDLRADRNQPARLSWRPGDGRTRRRAHHTHGATSQG